MKKTFVKKDKPDLPICQNCLTKSLERDYYWILKKEPIAHCFLACDKCCKENKYEINKDKFYRKPRPVKKKIDTSNWIIGTPTTKGAERFIFIKNGEEVSLLAETGLKQGLTPKLKD